MVKLRLLYKEYNLRTNLKALGVNAEEIYGGEIKKVPITKQGLCWPEEFLPITKYFSNPSEKYLEMMESWKDDDLCSAKPEKLVKILTQIDLNLIKAVSATDLVKYEGSPSSLALSHIIHKTSALQLLIKAKFTKRMIFGMLKHALKYKNYNLIHTLIKSLQSMRLSGKKMDKIAYYKSFLDKQENGVFPFDWMLQDCEDCNLNISSEVASLRFCKIIEKLKKMKELNYELKVSEKKIHIMYSHLWQITETNNSISYLNGKDADSNMFLIL